MLLASVWTLILVFMSIINTGCESRFSELSELEGNFLPDSVTLHDTITDTITEIKYDTLVVEKIIVDSIYVTIHDTTPGDSVKIPVKYRCYDFNEGGSLVAEGDDGIYYVISYNVIIRTSGEEVYFKQKNKDNFVLKNKTSNFRGSTAVFTVTKGAEEINLAVNVPGASGVIINNEDIKPCSEDGFKVVAELSEADTTEIDGETYVKATITYNFLNLEGISVANASQKLFAPVYVEEQPKEENKRDISINYSVEKAQTHNGYILVITGKIDNSLLEDTISQVRIPLMLSISTEAKKSVIGNEFDFSYLSDVAEVFTNPIQSGLTTENEYIKVTYNEYEKITEQLVSASGNTLTNQQVVKYYNNFNVEFGGETETIDLNVNVAAVKYEEGNVELVNNLPSKKVTVKYEATLDNKLTASANQEIEMAIEAVYFEGEEITFANKSVAFKSVLGQALRFTCVLSKTSSGDNYYYRYRQDGVTTWTKVEIEEVEYNWLLTNVKKTPASAYGLANRNADGTWDPGFIECTNFKEQAWIISYNAEVGPNAELKNHYLQGLGTKELSTMINQNYSQPVWHATHVQDNLYSLDGEYYLFN